MFAASDISSRTGAEGFFSEIGDGLAKVWEYIKRMFSWIFGGAFQKDAKEEVVKGKEEIKKTNKKIDEAQSVHITTDNMHAVVKEVEKHVDNLPESSAKKKSLKRKVNDLLAEPSPEKQAIEVRHLLPEVFEASLLNSHKLETFEVKTSASEAKLLEIKKQVEADSDSFMVVEAGITKFLNGLKGLSGSTSIHDYASAKQYIAKASQCLDLLERALTDLDGSKTAYTKVLHDTEAEFKNPSADKEDLGKKIQRLKTNVSRLVTICQLATGVIGGVRGSVQVIDRALVVVI
jgi:hypothetical protein